MSNLDVIYFEAVILSRKVVSTLLIGIVAILFFEQVKAWPGVGYTVPYPDRLFSQFSQERSSPKLNLESIITAPKSGRVKVFLTRFDNLYRSSFYENRSGEFPPPWLVSGNITQFALKVSLIDRSTEKSIIQIRNLASNPMINSHCNRFLIPKTWQVHRNNGIKRQMELLPYCASGDLKQYLSKKSESEGGCVYVAEKMIFQIVDSLAFFHRQKYAYGGVKLDNILVSRREVDNFSFCRVSLFDFDFCRPYSSASKRFCNRVYPKGEQIEPACIPYYGTPIALNAHHLAAPKNSFNPFLHDVDGLVRAILSLCGAELKGSPIRWKQNTFFHRSDFDARHRQVKNWLSCSDVSELGRVINNSVSIKYQPMKALFKKMLPFLASLHLPPFRHDRIEFQTLSRALKEHSSIFATIMPFATSLRTYTDESGWAFKVPAELFESSNTRDDIILQLICVAYERLTGFIITLTEATELAGTVTSCQQLGASLCEYLGLNVTVVPEVFGGQSTEVLPEQDNAPCQPHVYIDMTGRQHYSIKIRHPEGMSMHY